ncbi:hypothetical protein BDW22DRAFT_1359695 [Trametopsis cervina]|nr:hypothetical protein BDW22DRAFT_1359695 [Trametopsis cervina]
MEQLAPGLLFNRTPYSTSVQPPPPPAFPTSPSPGRNNTCAPIASQMRSAHT